MWLLNILMTLLIVAPVFILLSVCAPAKILLARVTGQRVAKITMKWGYDKGTSWKSPVWVIEPGKLGAWRYPATKIGHVILNEADGTGYYCGDISWRWA